IRPKKTTGLTLSNFDTTKSLPLDAIIREAPSIGIIAIYPGNDIFSSIMVIDNAISIIPNRDINFDNEVFIPINLNVDIIAPAINSQNLDAGE
ncbi:TPA: hypothetical protein NN355_004637, partial [Salmonella enterica]|nr:hypothetical protein [Salmonella enterica]